MKSKDNQQQNEENNDDETDDEIIVTQKYFHLPDPQTDKEARNAADAKFWFRSDGKEFKDIKRATTYQLVHPDEAQDDNVRERRIMNIRKKKSRHGEMDPEDPPL